jgi:hypothetical protein
MKRQRSGLTLGWLSTTAGTGSLVSARRGPGGRPGCRAGLVLSTIAIYRWTKLTEIEVPESSFSAVVQHPQVVGLMEIVADDIEVVSVPLTCQLYWHLMSDELAQALGAKPLQQFRVLDKIV